MNISFYRLLLCVPVCAGALGCSQSEALPEAGDRVEVVLFGSLDDCSGARTRTVIGETLDNGALAMNWGIEDRIGVFGDVATSNECFTSTNTYPIRETGFKGNIATGEAIEYAYYPYSEAATDKNAIPVTIPAVQEYSGISSVSAYDFKASDKIIRLDDGSYKCNMRQMTSMLRLDISLDDITECLRSFIDGSLALPDDEKLLSVTVSSDEVSLAGDFSYDLTANPMELKAGAAASRELTVNLTQTPLLKGTVTVYVVVAPGAHCGKTLTFDIQTSNCAIQITPTALCDFESGKFYVVPLDAAVFGNEENNLIVIDNLIPDTPDPEIDETANCYMITASGSHSFPATVIGNGDSGIIDGAGFHTSTSAISPRSAKLMWQDTENFISEVSLEDGRVNYTANGNVGNAVIAVFGGEDCTGDILWSWHIWGVGDTLPEDDVVTNQAGADFSVMDRTLGAWSKTSTNATLYQWGRKDPFPNSSTYYVDGAAKDISASYNVYAPTESSEATIEAGVLRPDCLMSAYKILSEGNWLSVNNDLLWGDSNVKDQYTWYSNGKLSNKEAGFGWTDNKTIYDPCPAGYRVSNRFTFTGFVVRTDGSAELKGDMNKGQIEEKVNCITESFFQGSIERFKPKYDNGYWFKANPTDTAGAYYPMTGYRKASDGGLEKSTSYYYSSPNKNKNKTQAFSIGEYTWEDKAEVSGAAGNNGKMNTMDWKGKWEANPVRCVRVQAPLP